MKREKISALFVMAASIVLLFTVILLAKIYWATLIDESKVLKNQTAPFERQAYQEREYGKILGSDLGLPSQIN